MPIILDSIVHKIKNGDTQAIKILYELFYKSTFNAAYFITRDSGLAEDAVHDVFIKVHEKIDQLLDISKIEFWLCRMATNKSLDIMRNRSKSVLSREIQISSCNQNNNIENLIVNNEEKEIIRRNINNLSPDYKIVVYYKYYRDLTVKEISSILEVPEGTIKTWLTRARKEMKKNLRSTEESNTKFKPKVYKNSKGV